MILTIMLSFQAIEAFGYIGGYIGMWLGISLYSIYAMLEDGIAKKLQHFYVVLKNNKMNRVMHSPGWE